MGKSIRQRQSAAETAKKNFTKHGLYEHDLYYVWRNMMRRCYDRKAISYKSHGERGIRVYPPWHDLATFITAIEALIGPRPGERGDPKRHSLDRIDVNGHYRPCNVRWATPKQQAWNKRWGRDAPDVHLPTMTCLCGSDWTSHHAFVCLTEDLPWDEAGTYVRANPALFAAPIAPPLPSIVQHLHTGRYFDCLACVITDPVPNMFTYLALGTTEEPEDWCWRNVGRAKGLLGLLGC